MRPSRVITTKNRLDGVQGVVHYHDEDGRRGFLARNLRGDPDNGSFLSTLLSESWCFFQLCIFVIRVRPEIFRIMPRSSTLPRQIYLASTIGDGTVRPRSHQLYRGNCALDVV